MSRRQRSSTRAQALVEFALVAPIFFLMLFALIDFGRYVYYVQILNNAAREGARYAIVHGAQGLPSSGPAAPGTVSSDPSGANVKSTVRNYLVGVIGQTTALTTSLCWRTPLDAPCNGSPSPRDNSRGNIVDVTVDYQFRSVIPVVPIPPITVQGASTLVINN
jgi:Flp pilus assembly protein TadG